MASGREVSTTTRVVAAAEVAIIADSEVLSVAVESPRGAGDDRASTASLGLENLRAAALLQRGTRLDLRLDEVGDEFDDVEVSPPLAPTSCCW